MSLMLLGVLNAQAAGGDLSAYDLLETTTLSSSASSVTFSGLDSYTDYKHLQVRMVLRGTNSNVNDSVNVRLNGNTSSGSRTHRILASGSSVISDANSAGTNAINLGAMPAATASANLFSPFVMDLLDFASVAKNPVLKTFCGNLAATQVGLYSGLLVNTSAVTSIQFSTLNASFAANSRFSLYGIKGA